MKAIVSLYHKLEKEATEKKALAEENQNLKKENEFYKNRSNLLSLQNFSNDFDNNLHIFWRKWREKDLQVSKSI